MSLYGEVQKEVIQATLASDFGIDVTFRETTTIYIERPAGPGEAVEHLEALGNPFPGGARVARGPGAGRLGRRVPARRRHPLGARCTSTRPLATSPR